MAVSFAYVWRQDGKHRRLQPTTLAQLGKSEEFLESVIADAPDLLGLESRETGVYGPFVPYRQIEFATPQGRAIRPDIVLLAASGHPIIVEVKLTGNAELNDRRVIAQVVDYASSFAALDEDRLWRLFLNDGRNAGSWPELIEKLFPDEDDPEELARTLMRRFKDGEINLVVATDRAPTGLREMVEAVTSQSALAFDFTVAEIRPHVDDRAKDEVVFLPNLRVETEIVARTAVTVIFEEGTPKPGVAVNVVSVQDVEKEVRKVRSRPTRRGTAVNGAMVLLESRLADLFREKRLSPFHCWRGYSIGSEIMLEPHGHCYIGVNFTAFSSETYHEGTTPRVEIHLGVRGRRDHKERANQLFTRFANDAAISDSLSERDVAPEHFSNGISWPLPYSAKSADEWTPEDVADLAEKVFRLLAARIPFKAKQP
jgi:hypothetical protein